MTEILLSASLRQGVHQLQNITRLIQATEGRLSSGKKVSGPIDNPSAFFTASSFNTRASDLTRVLDDAGTKLQTLSVADAAVTAITALVQSAISDLDTALASPEPNPTATGNIIVSSETDITDLAGVANNDQFDIQVGAAGAVTITINNNDTPTDLLNKIDAIANVDASFTTEGFLQIATTNGENLILTETSGTPLAGFGITAGTFDATSSTSSLRTTTAAAFDAIRIQINELAADATFNGKNLLLGDGLTINFNEDGSSSLTVSGATLTATGLNIAAAQNNLQLDTDITAAKADLEASLDTLRNFATSVSTDLSVAKIREEFNTGIRDLLLESSDNLILADINLESATLLSLQTRQDLTTASLSILGNSENSILRLLS